MKKEVELMASGYEWTCPCGCLNKEIEVPGNGLVKCGRCRRVFRIGEYQHAQA